MAHNKFEIKFHPDNYRKKYCPHFILGTICMAESYCSDAHSDFELTIKPIHLMKFDYDFYLFKFKTKFCPIPFEHNLINCVYAHSW